MEITNHRKALSCFFDLESCHDHKTTAVLCCLDRANGLSVIKLFCSAETQTRILKEQALTVLTTLSDALHPMDLPLFDKPGG